MSQPSYPSDINPKASDEALALSVVTTGGGLPDQDTVGAWLRPSDAASALFVLENSSNNKRASNPVWNYFHPVKCAKPGVPEEDLPKKWLEHYETKAFMACNKCGELVVSGTIDPKSKKLKPGSVTAQGMKTHLQSGKHSTTAEALDKLVGPSRPASSKVKKAEQHCLLVQVWACKAQPQGRACS